MCGSSRLGLIGRQRCLTDRWTWSMAPREASGGSEPLARPAVRTACPSAAEVGTGGGWVGREQESILLDAQSGRQLGVWVGS